MKIIFAGTPSFALPCLNALLDSKHQLVAVYTQPDRPAGRGQKLQASPVKEWALSHHLPVRQPLHFKEQKSIDELASFTPDVMVVIAYGLILPQSVLHLPRFGCINVHASLLPRWRGASPIQQAILHGDEHTGVTIMQMEQGLDTGPILQKVTCQIGQQTAGELHDCLADLAISPLLKTLDDLSNGETKPEVQNENLATYAPKILKNDALINWQQPAEIIARQIRAFHPWPIAHTKINDSTLRIFDAIVIPDTYKEPPGTILSIDKKGILVGTLEGALLIKYLQFPGSRAMSSEDWFHSGKSNQYLHVRLQ